MFKALNSCLCKKEVLIEILPFDIVDSIKEKEMHEKLTPIVELT